MLIMKDGKVGPAHLKIASSQSYTLKEIEALVRQFLQQSPLTDKLAPELILSSLIVWLAKREREGLG